MYSVELVEKAAHAVNTHKSFRWIELGFGLLMSYYAYRMWGVPAFEDVKTPDDLEWAVSQGRISGAYLLIGLISAMKALFNWRGDYFARAVLEQSKKAPLELVGKV